MNHRRFIVFISLIVCLAVPGQAQKVELAIEDLAKVNEIGTALKLSLDGRFVAYEVQDRSLPGEADFRFTPIGTPPVGIRRNVWIVDTESRQAHNLTPNLGNNWGPSWSPDGKYLAYYSDRNHKPQLWLWDVRKGGARLCAEAMVRPYTAMDTVRWTPDGKKILVKLVPEGMSSEEFSKLNRPYGRADEPVSGKSKTPMVRVYSSKSSPDPREAAANRAAEANSVTNFFLSDLALVDVSNGRVERIAKRVKPTWYESSPKGDQIAFVEAKGTPEGDVYRFAYDLAVISLADGKTHVLVRGIRTNAILFLTITWSPDGESLAYTAVDDTHLTYGLGTQGNCYIVSVSNGQQRLATSAPHPIFLGDGFRGPLWSADGRLLHFLAGNAVWTIDVATGAAREAGKISGKDLKDIVATANDAQAWSPGGGAAVAVLTVDNATKDSGFYRLDTRTGASSKLLEQNKEIPSNGKLWRNASLDGKTLVYVAEDTAHPPDVWIADSSFHEPRKLTNINPHLSNIPMGVGKLVEWTTADGQALKGALLLPANYQEGKRYPLIVEVYGGEMMSNRLNRFGMRWVTSWATNKQLFATRGYAVLEPDMPLKVGSPMRDIAKTVLPGVDKIIAMGIVDPDRIGVMGLSYGGYCVLSLIVQSKIFKAAIMHAGEGDLFAGYGEMNEDGLAATVSMIEKGPWGMGGTPWEYRDRYIENSPFFYLDCVETPLLITHGTGDTRVPVFLGEQIFVGLRRLGKEVTYVKYKGEEHVFEYASQVDELNRTFAWFDDHLKNPADKSATERKPD